MFTRALHWSLSWAISIQSTPSHSVSLRSILIPSRSKASFECSQQAYFLRWGVVSPMLNPQAGGPPLVGCPQLLIQYIRSCPPELEGVSSIHNLRASHAVMTGPT
jgi:hypothetical protein